MRVNNFSTENKPDLSFRAFLKFLFTKYEPTRTREDAQESEIEAIIRRSEFKVF